MKRIGKRIAGSIVVLVAMSVSVGAASAQEDDHPSGTTPSALSVDPPFITSGRFTPGTRQHLGIAAAAIQQVGSYRGTLSSAPIAPLATMVASAGSILWIDVLIPADFELGVDHRITVVDDVTGAVVAVSDFYVGVDGTVHAFAPASAGSGSASGSGSGSGGGSGASSRSAARGGQLARAASDSDAPAKLGVGLVALAALTVLTVHKGHDEMVNSS